MRPYCLYLASSSSFTCVVLSALCSLPASINISRAGSGCSSWVLSSGMRHAKEGTKTEKKQQVGEEFGHGTCVSTGLCWIPFLQHAKCPDVGSLSTYHSRFPCPPSLSNASMPASCTGCLRCFQDNHSEATANAELRTFACRLLSSHVIFNHVTLYFTRTFRQLHRCEP